MATQWRPLLIVPLSALALACPTQEPAQTEAPSATTSGTQAPSPTDTATATASPSEPATESATGSTTDSPTQPSTASITPSPSATASSTEAPSPTQSPTAATASPTFSPSPTAGPTPTPELTCPQRVIASYPFEDDPEGDTAYDTSSYTHDLTLLGGATFTESRSDDLQSLLLDGISARAQVDDAPALDLESAVSIETWLYLDELPPEDPGPNWWTVATKGSAVSIGTERNYSLYIRSDGLVNWSLSRPDQTAQGECRYGTINLEAKRWYHIVVTASPEDGGTKAYYVDGVLDLKETSCENTSLVTNDGPFIVGDSDEPNHNFKGQIDSLTLRDCALSAEDVQALYQP